MKKISYILYLLAWLSGTSLLHAQTTTVIQKTVNSYQGNSYQYLKQVKLATGFSFKATTGTSFSVTPHSNAGSRCYQNTRAELTHHFNSQRQETVLVEGIKDESELEHLCAEDIAISESFFDGLGRTTQQIALEASPDKQDIVQPVEYDQLGRIVKSYLPYVDTRSATLGYRDNALAEQADFYQNNTDTDIAQTDYPYQEVVFDNSPLNRVNEAYGIGEVWSKDDAGGKATTISREINDANEVRLWTVDDNGNATAATHYQAGELYRVRSIDENGNSVWDYTDKFGREVYKKVEVATGVYSESYQIYDQMNRLAYIIMPEGVSQLNATGRWDLTDATLTAEQLYRYEYDERGRLIASKAPGQGEEQIVYDSYNRPLLTSTATMREADEWIYRKYDELNRVAYTGKYSTTKDQASLTAEAESAMSTSELYEEKTQPSTWRVSINHYTNKVYPTSIDQDQHLVTHHYDDYDTDHAGTDEYTYTPGSELNMPEEASTRTLGFETVKQVSVLEPTAAMHYPLLSSAVFYDDYGRAIHAQSNNVYNPGSAQRTYLEFDNHHHLIKSKSVDKGTMFNAVITRERYAYDHRGRLLEKYHQVDDHPEVQTAAYEYNSLGQLIDKKLHVQGEDHLQSIDYRYSIQGWLTSINNSQLTKDGISNDDENDLFGMQLYYANEDAALGNTARYNGQISAVTWQSHNPSSTSIGNTERERSYTYHYNKGNRLTAAHYKAKDKGATQWNQELDAYSTSYSYDLNGNLQSLQRNAMDINGTVVEIDDLLYSYTGNRVSYVTDKGDQTLGFEEIAGITASYDYDANGNITTQANRGINKIEYNYLDKVTKVEKVKNGQTITIEYVYTAEGHQIQKLETIAGKTTQTDYIGNQVFKDYELEYIQFDEGRIRTTADMTTATATGSIQYEYYLKDHLGNVRMVVEKDEATGELIVSQENHYSPYGLKLEGYINNTSIASNPNPYGFGGAEVESALNTWHLHYRMYDPAIGMFWQVDPAKHAYNMIGQYSWPFNDPANFIDPLGAEGEYTFPVVEIEGTPSGSYDNAPMTYDDILDHGYYHFQLYLDEDDAMSITYLGYQENDHFFEISDNGNDFEDFNGGSLDDFGFIVHFTESDNESRHIANWNTTLSTPHLKFDNLNDLQEFFNEKDCYTNEIRGEINYYNSFSYSAIIQAAVRIGISSGTINRRLPVMTPRVRRIPAPRQGRKLLGSPNKNAAAQRRFEQINNNIVRPGTQNRNDFITEHAYIRHKFNPSQVSSRSKTQYGEGIDVADIRAKTMNSPDDFFHSYDSQGNIYATTYKKRFRTNISTEATRTRESRVIINHLNPSKSTQFPYYKRGVTDGF